MEITMTIKFDDGDLEKLFTTEPKKEEEKKVESEVSMYARFFDDTCPAWTKDAGINLMFLKCQQNYANDRLKTKGHLFLNEVYDMLGIPRSSAGQIVGWKYDESNPIGDNCVDFDIFSDRNNGFVNGYETTVLLDFNVDGSILDYI